MAYNIIMVKAYIFDYDNTVSDRERGQYPKFKKFIKENLSYNDEYELEAIVQDLLVFDERGNTTILDRITKLQKKYKFSDEIVNKFVDYSLNFLEEESYTFDDTIETLLELKKRGYKLGIITNGEDALQMRKVRYTGLDKIMDEVITSDAVKIEKPDVRIYQMMADRLGVKCEECVFVGDNFSTDILGAYRAKMIPVLMFYDTHRCCDLDIYRISTLRELLTLEIK